MLIDGVATLVAFVVFAAPGALWLWRAERRRSASDRSALLDASLVTLASTAFSLPAVGVALGVLWLLDRDLSALKPWLGEGDPTPRNAVGFLALLAGVGIVSCAAALVVERRFGKSLVGPLDARRSSAWQHVLRDIKQPSWDVLLDLALDDGSTISGYLDVYTPDQALADREIVLRAPIVHSGPDRRSLYAEGASPSRVVVRGETIRAMAVRYVD